MKFKSTTRQIVYDQVKVREDYVAHKIEKFQWRNALNAEAMCGYLECSEDALFNLALCKMPTSEDKIKTTADYAKIKEEKLREILDTP